jgi:hypothetical protein
LGKVDLAAKHSVVFDGEAEGTHIAFNDAARAELDASSGHDVALDLPLDEHIAR